MKTKEKFFSNCFLCNEIFSTNNTDRKYCSFYCSTKNHFKNNDVWFQSVFNKKFSDFEYVTGYKNAHEKFTLKCKKCNFVFDRSAQCIRRSNSIIFCKNCNDKTKLIQKILFSLNRVISKRIRNKTSVYKVPEEKTCKECGLVFKSNNSIKKFCNKSCSKKMQKRNHNLKRNRLLTINEFDTDISLYKLIKKFHSICCLCNKKINKKDYYRDKNGFFITGPNYPTLDHIVPLSKGGSHTWENIQLAHHICNSIKSDNL